MAKEGAAPTAPEETAQTTTQPGRAEGDVFFTAPDGSNYASADELTRAWASFVPKSEYTKKTQGLATERAQLEQQKREWEAERRKQEERFKRSEEYEMFDRFINSRPDAYRRWKQEIQAGASPNDLREQIKQEVESKYGTKLKELDEWRQQKDNEAIRQKVYAEMKTKYSDFDEIAMDQFLDDLANGDPARIAEALYFSQRGRKSQTEIAEELERSEREKSEAGIPGGASPSPARTSKVPKGATIDDMRELGKAKYRNTS